MIPCRLRNFAVSRLLIINRRSDFLPLRCLGSRSVTANVPLFKKSEGFLSSTPTTSSILTSGRRHVITDPESDWAKVCLAWSELNYDEFKKVKGEENILLIDVREPHEVEKLGMIPGAINIPLSKLVEALFKLSDVEFQKTYKRNKPDKQQSNIIFYGAAKWGMAAKSGAAVQMANRLGYMRVRHYVGGFTEWQQKEGTTTQ